MNSNTLDVIGFLILLGTPTFLTIVATALICRFYGKRGRQPQIWPGMILSCIFAGVFWFCLTAATAGLKVITIKFWNQQGDDLTFFFGYVGLDTAINIFFSAVVVWIYQWKYRRKEDS